MALSALEVRLVERLEKARPSIERDLEAWVNIPTGWNFAPGLTELRGILRHRLEALGGVARELPGAVAPGFVGPRDPIPPTLVVEGPLGASPSRSRPLLFCGHLDTVFDPNGSFTTFRREGDRAIGPGVSDMKGGLAIMIAALEALHAEGVARPWTVVLNSDEETGSYHSMEHLRALAPLHGAAFVLEPALPGGGLVIERMGSGQLLIEAHGRAAHAGRDFASGVSAITALAEAMSAAARVSAVEHGRIVNIGVIEGGEASNIVPAHARAKGSVRFRDRAAGEAIARALEPLAMGTPDQPPCVTVELSLNRPAKPLTAALRPLIDICLGAAKDLGHPLSERATGGSSDGNVLEDAGLPSLDSMGVCGGNLHRHDEFVELSSLGHRAALLAITALRVDAFLKPGHS
ncbi:MAG: M20/M25/M40 family metallo-hydrolase [Phycisphaeraceae bacterium]|nr:M20/M25/M40 family metallo-hydrolase [Phycisphaeraceae bacterium]